jgi:hypothetical protein
MCATSYNVGLAFDSFSRVMRIESAEWKVKNAAKSVGAVSEKLFDVWSARLFAEFLGAEVGGLAVEASLHGLSPGPRTNGALAGWAFAFEAAQRRAKTKGGSESLGHR